MLSRKSYFNPALYRKLLSRFWPMWGGVTALASLAPLIFFLGMLQSGPLTNLTQQRANMEDTYYVILTNLAPAFMLGYGVLCAMAVWSYLYQHRSVSLMHTLPVTRTGLFVTGCCAGLTFMLLPMAVAGLLLFLASACFGLATPVAFLQCAAGLVLLSLLNFGFATLCAMVTGNLMALPVFYFIGNFLAVILDWLVSTLTRVFFFGVYTDYSGSVEWLSPTVFIYQHVRSRTIWEEVQSGNNYYSTRVGVELEGLHILLIYGMVGVLLLIAAWLIYQRRPSESAGDVVSLAFMRPVFKLGVGVCAALSGGQLLYAIFSVVSDSNSLLRMGLCMLAAGTIGFWIADMLVQKSLRVWKTTAVGAGIMAALSLGLCLCVQFDLLGVERRIPDTEEITAISLRLSGINRETVNLTAGEDDAYIQQVLALHSSVVASKRDILAITNGDRDGYLSTYYATTPYDDRNDIPVHSLRLTYDLKDGRVLERRYSIPVTEALLAQSGSYAARLSGLLNDPGIQLKRVNYNEGYTTHYLYIAAPYYEEEVYLSGRQDLIEQLGAWQNIDDPKVTQYLYDALVEDVRAGRWGYTDLMDYSSQESWLELHFEQMKKPTNVPDGAAYDSEYDSFYICYTPQMTSLTGALLEIGVPAAALQRPPQYMTEEEQKLAGLTMTDNGVFVDRDGRTYYIQEQVVETEKASIGVIGGADGPTAVFVTGG